MTLKYHLKTSFYVKGFLGDYGDVMKDPMDFTTWPPTTTTGEYLIVVMYYMRCTDQEPSGQSEEVNLKSLTSKF